MENEALINKIKSIYILKNLFNYIKDKNFKYKLFFHSQHFQQKFDMNLIEFKEKYLEKVGFVLDKFIYIENYNYQKDYLQTIYDNFLKQDNLDKEKIENIIYDIIENTKINDIDEEDINKIKNYEKKYILNLHYLKYYQKQKILKKILLFIFLMILLIFIN